MRSEETMRRKKRGPSAGYRLFAVLLAGTLGIASLTGCAGSTDQNRGAGDPAGTAGEEIPGEAASGQETAAAPAGSGEAEDHTPAGGPSMAQGLYSPSVEQAVPAEKKETVTVRADASGKPYEKTVEVELSRPAGEQETEDSGTDPQTDPQTQTQADPQEDPQAGPFAGRLLRDRTSLYGIANTEGDEEFYRADGETILWQDRGQILRYEGKSDAELPVEVRVRYYLDGEEKKPEEMPGVTGDVRIRFDYRNRTGVTEEADGRTYETIVPFSVMSAVVLDGDIFTDITAENGKIAEIGGETAVIGYAFPGVEEALDLAHYEVTEEVDIPAYVEVRAHAEGFSLPFTATVITHGLFADLEDEDLEDADDLTEEMGEFRDASGKLAEAASELYDGAGTFGSYLKKYVRAASEIGDGVDAMKQGLAALDENGQQLREGAQGLSDALALLNRQLSEMDLSALDPANEENAARTQALGAAAAGLAADAQALSGTHLPALQAQIGELAGFAQEAEAYRQAVEQGIADTETAVQELEAFDEDAFAEEMAAQAGEQAGAAARKAAEEISAGRAAEGAEALSEEEIGRIEAAAREAVDLSTGAAPLKELHEQTAEKIRQAMDTEVIRTFAVPETIRNFSGPESQIDLTDLQACLQDMDVQLQTLQAFAANMGSTAGQLQQLQAGLGSLQSAVRQLSEGSSTLNEGLAAYGEGVSALASGASQLGTGMREFSKAGSSLTGGYGAITEGLKAFSEGIDEFDREGVQKLGRLAGEDLAEVLRRLKALRNADRSYQSFSGILPEQKGTVRFIIETDGLEN